MISDWGEVVTRYPYGNVRMDHLLSKEQYFLYSIDNVLHYLMDIGNYIVDNTILTLVYINRVSCQSN